MACDGRCGVLCLLCPQRGHLCGHHGIAQHHHGTRDGVRRELADPHDERRVASGKAPVAHMDCRRRGICRPGQSRPPAGDGRAGCGAAGGVPLSVGHAPDARQAVCVCLRAAVVHVIQHHPDGSYRVVGHLLPCVHGGGRLLPVQGPAGGVVPVGLLHVGGTDDGAFLLGQRACVVLCPVASLPLLLLGLLPEGHGREMGWVRLDDCTGIGAQHLVVCLYLCVPSGDDRAGAFERDLFVGEPQCTPVVVLLEILLGDRRMVASHHLRPVRARVEKPPEGIPSLPFHAGVDASFGVFPLADTRRRRAATCCRW